MSGRAPQHRPMAEDSYRFRSHLLDLLDRFTPAERFFYLDEDTIVMVCPLCDGPLGVTFAGAAPRADLDCHRGCDERDIVAKLREAGR